MKNIYLVQVQQEIVIDNTINHWLPYSVGCLWSYAQQFSVITDNFNLAGIFFDRSPIKKVINKITTPSVVALSCYVWNQQYNIALADAIKKQWPSCIIVLGGPNTNSQSLEKYTNIDCVVLGEGEVSFTDILERVQAGSKIPKLYEKNRLTNLNIPSPYTTGVFDQIISDNPSVHWAMTTETNRGCPYSCTFCDWGSLTYSKVRKFNGDRIASELAWAGNIPISYLFCADANFGMFKEQDLAIARLMLDVSKNGVLSGISLQFAKNSTDVVFEIAKILGKYSKGITVSVQSLNESTLVAIKRKNMDLTNIARMLSQAKAHGVLAYTELILGLPNETLGTWKKGITEVLELGQHDSLEVWFCQLLENSQLNSIESKNKYAIQSVTASDYQVRNQIDVSGISEYIELVNQTSTMSTNDMAESFIFSWMIIHLHIAGYTQLYAKYCVNMYAISYLDFYNTMFELIQSPGSALQQFIISLRDDVLTYLTTGILDKSGHTLIHQGNDIVHKNKNNIFALGEQCMHEHLPLHTSNCFADIVELQHLYIYDSDVVYPVTIHSSIDVISWNNSSVVYSIQSKLLSYTSVSYLERRSSLLKNTLLIKKE